MGRTVTVLDEAALAEATQVFRRAGPALGPDGLSALAAADPRHDERLSPEYRHAVVPFYASSALGEHAAGEYARRAAAAGPASLREGFRRQAGDEDRHAALDRLRLAQLGVAAQPEAITPGVAAEMRDSLRIEDPFERMFLTNVIGETALAGATFPFVIALAEANGDRLSAALNSARLADERRHVAFAVRAFEILLAQDERNRDVLQGWQDEHFASGATAFLAEVVPALEQAPNRPRGDWLREAAASYKRRAARLGLRAPEPV